MTHAYTYKRHNPSIMTHDNVATTHTHVTRRNNTSPRGCRCALRPSQSRCLLSPDAPSKEGWWSLSSIRHISEIHPKYIRNTSELHPNYIQTIKNPSKHLGYSSELIQPHLDTFELYADDNNNREYIRNIYKINPK
eukprot:TRINITY_DN3722_c0_g2_i1.p1 TRINITY_DN3722_c0_g2~~TRINITY_DN3722_c0_g2_i1.p1  ORF type:complete len:136 (-),score=14.57 TRINITY_DN3722_c0_g2_i1:8-415(-)